MDFFRMLRNAVRTSDLEADDENDHDSLNQSESSSNMSSNTHIPGMKTKLIHQKSHALNTTYFKIAFGKGTVIKKNFIIPPQPSLKPLPALLRPLPLRQSFLEPPRSSPVEDLPLRQGEEELQPLPYLLRPPTATEIVARLS